mgnify:CR=1 FL=1
MCSVGREILNSLVKGSFVTSFPSSTKKVRSGLRVLTRSARLKSGFPNTTLISVADREAQIFMNFSTWP